MSPWVWGIGAVILAVIELHTPGIYLIWLALGAALTALASLLFPLALEGQLLAFAAAAALSCVLGHFVYRRVMRPAPHAKALNERGREMIGKHGTVCEALKNGQGKVRLGDSVWLAEGPDLEAGTPIVVRAVRGTIAVVEKP